MYIYIRFREGFNDVSFRITFLLTTSVSRGKIARIIQMKYNCLNYLHDRMQKIL